MNVVNQTLVAKSEKIYDNQNSGVLTRIVEYQDNQKEVVKTFSPSRLQQEPTAHIVDYEIFLGILNNVGIRDFVANSEFSLFELLLNSEGEIDLNKVQLLARELQLALKTISLDQGPITSDDLIGRSPYIMTILEGLTTILFYESQKSKKTPRIYDIVIGSNYEVSLHLEYFEGQTVENLINLVLENKGNPAIIKAMQSALGAIVDATSAIDSTRSIHFDFAPSNIILRSNGQGALIDFSISYFSTEQNTLNENWYSFGQGENLSVSENQHVVSEFSQLGSGRQNYSGPANFPGKRLTKAKTSDSFSATLSCLDIVSLSNEIRDDITTAILAVNVDSRNEYLDDLIVCMSERYRDFWRDSNEDASLLQAEFFLALRQVTLIGLNETIPTTPEGIVLPNLYAVKNSAALVPMLIYALYQCLNFDENTNLITIDEQKLYIVRKTIDLCSIKTEDFVENPDCYREYCHLITQEPMFSATKRSLPL